MKKRILALVLTVALAVGLVVEAGMPLPVNAAATVPDGRVSDANTTGSYTAAFGDGTSTRYSGRVWTDKTVYTGDAEFNGTMDGRPQTFRVTNDSDFLVAYSALATSTSVSGKMKAPVDVVLVIDNSGSMVNNGYLDDTVKAVNNSIKTLMEMNEHNRVAVVLYDTDVATLLPLGRYTPSGQRGGDYIGYTGYNTIYFYNTVNEKVDYNNPGNTWLGGIDTDDCLDTGSSRGTNIQLGVYTGLNILAETKDTTVEINGKTVQRIPALVLLSDGAATYSYSGTNWWETGTSVQGPGNSAYYGNGMLAMATAQYMKQQVTKHYTGTINESVYAAKVYTVGMGVTSLSGDEKNLAYLTLDPSNHWDNNMGRSTKTAFETYQTGRSVNIDVERRETYTMYHPGSDDITTLEYTNAYYDAAQAEDVVKVFEDIMGDISVSAPEVPTEVAPGEDPVENGYITYTDTIGEYMEVKDVKEILWSGVVFTQKTKKDNGDGSTTYTFEGTIDSPVYGNQNLSDVIITVRNNGDQPQTLTVQIPASAIPLRVNTIKLDANNQVEENTNNGAYPIRVFYTVGMKDGVIDENGKVNPQAVTQEYLDKNTNPDGTVNFYSNLYSGHKQNMAGVERTVGDANVTFEPSNTNPYYFNQEQVPLYTDPDCTTPAKGPVDLSDTYYRNVTYYEDKAQPTAHVKITTSEYQTTDFETNADGQLCLKAGTYRISTLTSFIKDKEGSTTNTAQASYYPTYDKDAAGVQNGQFTVYLGNNGVLSAPMATGSLTLSKQVEGAGADRAKSFTFTVTLKDANDASLTGSYPYVGGVLQNVEGNPSAPDNGNLVLNEQGSGTVTLTHGQTITVRGLPVDATFTVSEAEANQDGYTTTVSVNGVASETATGTVGQSSTVAFTNTRAVGSLTVTKTVTGDMGDKSHPFAFSVTLTDANGDPMTGSVTYTKSGKEGESEQGALTLTDAGVGTFELTDGQSIAFNSLPVGTQYSVTETEADQNGYTTSVQAVPSANVSETDVVSGTIVADGATTVTYTNYRGLTPPTDVSDPGSVYQVMLGVGGICALTIVGCSFLVWRRRRRDWM